MADDYDAVEGDTGTTLRFTVTSKSTKLAIDLTGYTVTLKWKDSSGVLQQKGMSITDAANGKVEYQFLASELYPPRMNFTVLLTDGGGFVVSNAEPGYVDLKIRKKQT